MSTWANPRCLVGAAGDYLERGWSLTPVLPRDKKPGWPNAPGRAPRPQRNWQGLRLKAADLSRYFIPTANIGVNLGEPSGDLADIDHDCAEAIELADQFLPATWMFGRASKPRSHRLYIAAGAVTEQFKDVSGKMLVELRATPRDALGTGRGGHQTVFPPSVHPSGELISWTEDCDGTDGPLIVAAAELRRAVADLATAALIQRHAGRDAATAWISRGTCPPLPRLVAGRIRQWWRVPRAVPTHVRMPAGHLLERGRALAAKVPGAVSGSGGHDATWGLAQALVRGLGLDEDDALVILREWNTKCEPPWSEKDLLHKIRNAAENSRLPQGYLLDERSAHAY